MIPRGLGYDDAMRQFRWPKPQRFNIGRAVCERHAPDSLAMIVENGDGSVRNWTFGQLLAASSRLANALVARGIGKGDRVAVFLSQGAELTICHLAGYRMGAVVLPLFTLFGEEAIEYRLANAEASSVITDMSQLSKLLAVRDRLPHLKTIIVIGSGAHGSAFLDWDRLLGAASDRFATVDTAAEDPALLIYTSGTTGLPKGVVHTHNTSFWAIATLSATADMRLYDRFLLTLPMFHVGALLPLMVCIYNGLSCVMQRAFDPAITWKLIEGEKINVAMLVPAMVNFMLQVPEIETVDASSLRFFLCGAAPVPDHLVLSYDKRNIPVLQIYGLTETCGPVAVVSLDDYRDKVGSTGKAFMHTDVRIINVETGQDMPVDVPGELITRSKHNMIAYWNREKATLETLRDGWLYTGDIARMDADGYVFIADRSKDMIISGGENVYPAEVEGVLLTHPKIREVAVIGQASAKWGESPLAGVVKADPSLTEAEVLGYANGKLSRFKLPKAVVFIDEIPRNPSGKVLKRVLREQFPDDAPE